MDLYSRRVVGWAIPDSELVCNGLKMAVRQRRPEKGTLTHHSDRGCQYTSSMFQNLLTKHEITCSLSRPGNCYDNAPAESFFGTLKTELVHDATYNTRQDAKTDIFFYIEGFYNQNRRHLALGYVSPMDYEADCESLVPYMDFDFVSIKPG